MSSFGSIGSIRSLALDRKNLSFQEKLVKHCETLNVAKCDTLKADKYLLIKYPSINIQKLNFNKLEEYAKKLFSSDSNRVSLAYGHAHFFTKLVELTL